MTLFFYLLLRAIQTPHSLGTSVAAGLTLTAYLLTFHGSAFVVGIVLAWALYDRVRWFWPREEPEPSLRPLYHGFPDRSGHLPVIPSPDMDELHHRRARAREFWRLAPWNCGRSCAGDLQRPGLHSSAGWQAPGLCAAGRRRGARSQLSSLGENDCRSLLMPSLFGISGGVDELQPLVYEQGHFTLMPALHQFYGAYFLALLGLFLLAESTFKRIRSRTGADLFLGAHHVCSGHGPASNDLLLCHRCGALSGYARTVCSPPGARPHG